MNTERLLRAAARWKIPRDVALAVMARDVDCIYCRRPFGDALAPRAHRPSWEHIVNDESITDLSNIALCCMGCNASKGTKPLNAWLASAYCRNKAIEAGSMAEVALGAWQSE